ncbi:hypothetical protein ACOSP7_022328 [Xanthoceras sorbifolium]
MCFGVLLVVEAGFAPLFLESDALSMVNVVNFKDPPCFEIGLFILMLLSCQSPLMFVGSLTVIRVSIGFCFNICVQTLKSRHMYQIIKRYEKDQTQLKSLKQAKPLAL